MPLFIDGSFVEGEAGYFDDVNPAKGLAYRQVSEASGNDVDRAVQAAKKALKGPWGKLDGRERARLMLAIADEIDRRKEEFMRAEIDDTGKPVAIASRIDIPRGAANFRAFADLASSFSGETFEMHLPDGRKALNVVTRQPVGVISVICPWNLPLLLMTWKVAPALACGNTVVVKPSEETPHTATLLGEVMNTVGVPAGVYNVVHGFGPGSAGEALVQHDDVNAITFTGESKTGTAIMRDAALALKPVSFELGGKNPALIFDDANLDDAIAGSLRSVFTNTGQVCLCTERIYVARSRFDEFVAGMVKGAKNLVIGDPYNANTTTGPLISREHLKKVERYLVLAKDEGGKFHLDGKLPALGELEKGSFIAPAIVTGLDDNAQFCREEVFGPICHISPFDDDDEVIARANDTEYGLCAAVWTQDVNRAHQVTASLDVGIAWVNNWFLRDLRTPFGGSKRSGIGREGGSYSLDFYTELKNTCITLG
ncbi:MAG: 2-hydroxymuconic semialdehyde dehydrogenase [Deltaproteobacteria bacterium]|nr:2-hydroxymuconic semialdehyde dehydrogenase [Deltaproteobacteria bacterium]